MATTEMNCLAGGGGGLQSDSGTESLTARTDTFIPLSFEPKSICIKGMYSATDYVINWYCKGFNSSSQYSLMSAATTNRIDPMPVSSASYGAGVLIQNVNPNGSNGFTVRASNYYKNIEWYAEG